MDAETPGSAWGHTLLFWLIRAVQALFAGLILLIAMAMILGCLIGAKTSLGHPQVRSDAPHFISILTLVLVGGGLMIVIPCYVIGFRRMLWRHELSNWIPRVPRRLTEGDLDSFALVFAVFAAFDLYHFVGRNLAPSWHFPATILLFFALKYVLKIVLRRSILGTRFGTIPSFRVR